MILQVNGSSLEIDNQSSVADLIEKLALQDQRIALEVNETIIPRSKYADFDLNEGDICEIIKAVGGG